MNKVKKIISALLIICMCAVMAFVNKTDILAAGTARVSIGSASGTVGDTVSIDVSISASSGIGGATIYVSYDPSILALSGSSSNSGTAMVSFMDESTASSQSKTITFKIIGAGTSSLNVIGDSKVIDIDMQACSISKSSGSVTASAPASYSSDNTLSSLQISPGVLSPAFSPDVTTYTTSVGADCASLTVSAVPNDSKATVSVSGKRMDPGFNTTTITVTAENGSKRTYTIKTTKETNSASNENNQATGSDSSNGSTDNNNDIPDVQDPNSEAIQEPDITVDNAEYKIVSANDEHPLPDGYTPTEYDYNGTKVSAGVGIDTGVTIVYLESTDGKGESGYYVYDSVRKTFSQFVEVSQPQFTYCILAIDEASMELPEGYDAPVSERGSSFSTGQRQLLAFARTVASQPKILILDEATANIDSETEAIVQNSLAKMRQGRTTIAIAHRLSTIQDANCIYVLDKGCIIEHGSHEELLDLGGTYHKMYSLQAGAMEGA